jgi:hypothetical protein
MNVVQGRRLPDGRDGFRTVALGYSNSGIAIVAHGQTAIVCHCLFGGWLYLADSKSGGRGGT